MGMIHKAGAVAITVVLVGGMLSELGFRSRRLLSTIGLLLILCLGLDAVGEMTGRVMEIADLAGISQAAKCILKTVGVGYIGSLVSGICEGLGESTLSSAVMLICRLEAFIIILPYFEKTLSLGLTLLQ